jgi:hypothetical protein
MKCFSWLAAIVLLLLSAPATAFAERPRTPIDEATTFAICEYVDDSGIVDELINSGVEVVMRGWFKWGSDPSDWSAIAAGVARLHDAGVPVIGVFQIRVRHDRRPVQ